MKQCYRRRSIVKSSRTLLKRQFNIVPALLERSLHAAHQMCRMIVFYDGRTGSSELTFAPKRSSNFVARQCHEVNKWHHA
jgi:hypothetical protein